MHRPCYWKRHVICNSVSPSDVATRRCFLLRTLNSTAVTYKNVHSTRSPHGDAAAEAENVSVSASEDMYDVLTSCHFHDRPELKALCRQRSLAVSGNKAALIARLLLASATVSSLAPKAAATSPASPSLAIPDHPSNSYPAAIAKNTSSAPTLPPAIPDSLPIAVHSRARHAEISVAASTSLSYSALLPSKRTFTESTSSVSASARPTESVKLLTKIAPATASSALSLKKFQVLRPAMPTVPESSSSPAHATSSPLISARPSFTLRDLAGQYVWLLPLLGQTSFQSFLPKNMTPGCLQAVTAYLLTRVYCLLGQYETDSISAVSSQTTPRVENVTPLHSGVYQCSFGDDSKHTFVGATGEIISSDDNIRPDWSTFLATKDNTQDQFDLISLVRNQDDESFERGIGKAFRKRLSEMKDRDMASELLAVAESYVLAHVAVSRLSSLVFRVKRLCFIAQCNKRRLAVSAPPVR